MIQLTRLNASPLAVNSDLIKFIEEAPDTVLTLINGEKLVVRETTAEVIRRICQFRRSILCSVHRFARAGSENSSIDAAMTRQGGPCGQE